MTDYNGMYNIITHYEICKKEGMSPIIGVDLAIQVVNQNKAIRTSRFCTLLAKNYDGYLTLLQIVSQAQTANKMQEPHILLSSLPDLQGNIIALINAYETPMGDMIGSGRTVEDLTPILQTYKEVFGEENVVLEIIPQSKQENKQLSQANLVLRDLAQATQTPIIASNNFHYIRQSDQDAANIARCIKDGKRVYDEDRRVFQ
ncbi:MAG: PHP domain-containing protein [bacterium]